MRRALATNRTAGLFAAALLLDAATAAGAGPSLDKIYLPDPSYSSTFMGFFSTGAALADLNGDGFKDLVLSNGNDMSPQPLVVYDNLGGKSPVFSPRPDWISTEIEYMNDLAVGDVNGDGWLDVAVAVGFDPARNTATGGVELFLNHGGRLEPRASYRTAGGYVALGCDLGDIDGDGDLDLAVAVVSEGAGVTPPPPGAVFQPGRGRIYLNEDGALSPFPAWISQEGLAAADVLLADVNQDGWMDAAFAGERTAVFFGGPARAGGGIPLPRTAGWTSADRHAFSYSLDAGSSGPEGQGDASQVPTGEGLALAVSSGCRTACDSRFLLYRPAVGTSPVWRSDAAAFASKLMLADLNGDGYLDLVADQWGKTTAGAPLWLFQGGEQGFPASPTFVTQPSRVGQGVDTADLRHASLRTVRHRFTAGRALSVLTLPVRQVEGLVAVERQGRRLATSEYAWAPASNAVSLAAPLAAGESVTVSYQVSPVQDIVEAVWNPQLGSDIYFSFLTPTAPKP